MSGYAVDREKWSELTIFEQMGNIGSEVGRSINAREQGDETSWQGALERALDLFDATKEQLLETNHIRLKEVLRARDQYLQIFFANDVYGGDKLDLEAARSIERYFMQYAVAARLTR